MKVSLFFDECIEGRWLGREGRIDCGFYDNTAAPCVVIKDGNGTDRFRFNPKDFLLFAALVEKALQLKIGQDAKESAHAR